MVETIRRQFTPIHITALLLAVVAFVLFQPVVAFLAQEEVDYANHLSYLHDPLDIHAIIQILSMFPHFLYHLSVYTVYKIFSLTTFADAALVVSTFAYIAGTLVTYWLITRILRKPRTLMISLVYGAIAIALMLLMPIDIFTPTNLFVGYIGINAYHNPTIVLLKPTAIILFWCTVSIFQSPTIINGKERRSIPVLVCCAASVLCVMTKSSYMIALLPAMIIAVTYRGIRRQPVDWVLFIEGILLPAIVTLGLQMLLFRSSEGFIFAPLAVIYSWTRINPEAPNGIVWKFLLSILFPLLVYGFYFKAALKTAYLNLAWLVFIFGAAYMYLLAEGGERLAHANFTWSAICALFILFIVSTAFLVQQIAWQKTSITPKIENNALATTRQFWTNVRIAILIGILGLHIISGIYWYHVHITARSMGDIISEKW